MSSHKKRFLNRDGSSNVDPSSFKKEAFSDSYHFLLSMRWTKFLAFIAFGYFVVNLIFGTAYFLAGSAALDGIRAASELDRWKECFFFSVQTLATIGYGKVSPASFGAHLLVTVEALTGLIALALGTGIMFARFSRPTARIRFSENALITHLDGRPCLIFRMANARFNQIVEAEVGAVLTRLESTEEGQVYRELHDLPLDRDHTPIFGMTWTITHWIDEQSPLYQASYESLSQSDTELIVTVTGTDETFSQTVRARFSYVASEFVWDALFADIVSVGKGGLVHVAIDRLSEIFPVDPKSR
ncbi:MAG: ion channel [Oligoflexia bacterium]|nr:ion channel [Oligoflexia bacterium]